MIRRPPRSPLFPYPTLSRSAVVRHRHRPRPHHFAELGEPLAFLSDGNSADRIDPRQPGAHRLPHDEDRKSTRLNSSHSQISYAVFCLKKKTKHHTLQLTDIT